MSNKIKDMCKQEEVKFKTDIVNISSSVAGAIVSYAEGEKVELIVIGTRGRSGIKNMLIGSVATCKHMVFLHHMYTIVNCVLRFLGSLCFTL
jgi:Universal stress protein family